jgi:hypothetical protein
MATAEALIAVIGLPVNSDAVRALIATDRLAASVEPAGWLTRVWRETRTH